MSGSPILAVMARAPLPGACKTRLASEVGPEAAAALYRAMIEDTLDRLGRIPNVGRVLLAAPEHEGPAVLRSIAPAGWNVVPQEGVDLTERLLNALSTLGEKGNLVVFTGSDSPTLPAEALAQAFPSFDPTNSALVGPCDDGGYCLIGLTIAHRALFEGIPWSTAEVMATTRRRAERLGLVLRELSVSFDVDDSKGLERLREELVRRPALVPRSAQALGRIVAPCSVP